MHGVPAQTGFPRTLTKTINISAIFSTLNPILSVANLSRLECAETQFARKPRAYEYTRAASYISINSGLKKESVSGKSSTCRNPKGMRVETGGCPTYIAHGSFNRGLAGRTTVPYVGGCASTRVASARRENRSPINFHIVLTSDIFHCDDEYRR